MSTVKPQDVSVRFFDATDVEDIAAYFYDSPAGFVHSIGLNVEKMDSKSDFIKKYHAGLEKLSSENKKPKVVTVFYQNEKIGFHTTTHPIPDESVIMHAHFFNTPYRNKGIGMVSGLKAAELFFKEFNLKEIILKVPLQNIAPIRLTEKLGLISDEIEVLDWPHLTHPMQAKVFRISYEKLLVLKAQFT